MAVCRMGIEYRPSHAEEQYQKTEHCLGIVWGNGGSTNLFNLLCTDGFTDDIRTNLYFTSQVNAKGAKAEVANHTLPFGAKPKDMDPRIFHVELRHREREEIFDRLWVVINAPETHANYTNRVAINSTNMAWTLTLPPPFASIIVNGNTPVDPEPPIGFWNDSGVWHKPEPKNTYLHHNAPFEMRSKPVTGGHGHQAMYDTNGLLIETTIAAGTADFVSPDGPNSARRHRNFDVYPYIRALQLDGNPVRSVSAAIGLGVVDAPTNLDRPCIYQGDYTDSYIERRPVLPTGKR
ncbi:MAG: hypothetical protein FWG50_00785 [Kiritimatiellaeota bacterium]|nr:hypothetical protein [Kiritimatiellota bacterium]